MKIRLEGNLNDGDTKVSMFEENAYMKYLSQHPNVSLKTIDLLPIDKVSNHEEGKVLFTEDAVQKALPSLVSMPVHVNKEMDGHSDNGEYKAIGFHLGNEIVKDGEGRVLRAYLALWSKDFAGEVNFIEKNKKKIGGSYEILAADKDIEWIKTGELEEDKEEGFSKIKDFTFTGSAILKKDSAAYPTSQLLGKDKQIGGETIMPKIYKIGNRDVVIDNIPDEHHAGIVNLITSFMAPIQEEVQKLQGDASLVKRLQEAFSEKKTEFSVEDLMGQLVTLEGQVTTLSDQLKDEREKRIAAEGSIADAQHTAAVDTKIAELAGSYNIPKEKEVELKMLISKSLLGQATFDETARIFSQILESKQKGKGPEDPPPRKYLFHGAETQPEPAITNEFIEQTGSKYGLKFPKNVDLTQQIGNQTGKTRHLFSFGGGDQ